jgi:hypothetical protein
MHRLFVVLATVVALGLLMPAAVLAQKPSREPLPAGPVTVTGSCSFDVLVEVVENREFITVFSSGKTIITGKLFVRVTNLSPGGKSMVLNVSGPGINNIADTSTFNLSGTSLIWFTGSMLLTKGPVTLTLDAQGNVIGFNATSKGGVNLCNALS